MKKFQLLTSLFILFSGTLISQEIKTSRAFINNYYDAEAFIYENNHEEALNLFLELCKIEPDNPNIWYKIGVCCLNTSGKKPLAEEYLLKASEHIDRSYENSYKTQTVPIDAYLYLGIAYRVNYKFEESRSAFNFLREYLHSYNISNQALVEMLDKEECITENAKLHFSNPIENITINNLGENVNSVYSDHSPAIDYINGILYFTSKRPQKNESDRNQDEDIFMSKRDGEKWGSAVRLGTPINTDEKHESVSVITSERNELVFFRSGNYESAKLYTSKSNDQKNWSKPQELSYEINSGGYQTHATGSKDIMFYTSKMKSGYGGLDIYMIRKLPNGEWSNPEILPENINTAYDEETPYLHSDGVTLYFSSKGHNTMGGYDIFKTKIDKDGTFSDPVNLGYPINTPNDDVAFILNPDGIYGYYSTVKEDGLGDMDLYEIVFTELNKDNSYIVYGGTVINNNGNIIKYAQITVKNLTTDELAGIYRSDEDGSYKISLLADHDYEISYTANEYKKASLEMTPTGADLANFKSTQSPILRESVMLYPHSYQEELAFTKNATDLNLDHISIINGILEKTKNIPDMIINIADEGSDSKLGAERYISIEKHLTNNGVNLKNIDRNNSFSNISQPSFNLKIILIDEPEIMSIDSVVIENILFDFNKYEIQKESYPNLDKLAAYLNENPSAKIEIDGHTDNIGSVNYNDILSYNRAKSAKDYLVSKGNNPENIITGKYGKTAPITNNLTPDGKDNPQGRKYNRRVEFKVLEQGKSAKLVIAKMIIDESYSSGINSNNEEAIAKTDNFARYEGKYTIQIVALKKSKPVNSFNNLTGVKESLSKDGWYRYYVGEFNSYNEAKNAITNLNLEKSEYSPFVRKLSFFEN